MRRKTLDALLVSAGLVMAVILLVGGILLTWGYNFANSNVRDQLKQQKIFFPPKGSPALDPKEYPALQKYAGKQVLDGGQAEAYANGYIKRHLEEMGGGKTYSELSTASRANPSDTKLAGQVQTAFRGETLRGLLLNAYAFWKIAQIALYGAIFCYVGAAVMALLSVLGFLHWKRVTPEERVGRAEAT
ncbi:hypothetical protein [Spirillospora albida]|uniref:hypothetical protein n=1 Tax=Spirillospora albida TaxID=58123 RepID=UPI0004BE4EBC|nr:hypothetical protein [Spirillospora albida]